MIAAIDPPQSPRRCVRRPRACLPTGPRIDCTGYRVRHDRIDKTGRVTLRHKGRPHHISIGNPYRGGRVVMLIAGLEIRVLDLDGNQLRRLTLDPTRDYQPIG